MRQVVSAMVISNKMTVEDFGGMLLSSPLLGDALMYSYTIPVERFFV